MYFHNKLKIFLKRPGQYFRYKNKFLRNLYFQLSKFMHFKTFYSRVYKKKNLNLITDTLELINKVEGYKLIKYTKLTQKISNINQVLEKINYDVKKIDRQKLSCSSPNEGIIKLKSSKDFDHESPELKFVTNKYLIEIVSRYLNCLPLLTNLSLWFSPNDKFFENSSQEYHLDHEDYRQVKGFLYLNDVDLHTGPMNIINATESNNIQKLINYKMTKSNKRINDKVIKDLKKDIVITENCMTGKSGDLLLCDTSSCFHFGSRIGNKPRFILAFQYVTPFGFSMDWNWRDSEKLPFKDIKLEANSLVGKVLGNRI